MPTTTVFNTELSGPRSLCALAWAYRAPLLIQLTSLLLLAALNRLTGAAAWESHAYHAEARRLLFLLDVDPRACAARRAAAAPRLLTALAAADVLYALLSACLWAAALTDPGYVARRGAWAEPPAADPECHRYYVEGWRAQQSLLAEVRAGLRRQQETLEASLGIANPSPPPPPPPRPAPETSANAPGEDRHTSKSEGGDGASAAAGADALLPPAAHPASADAGGVQRVVRQFEADGALRWCGACQVFKPDRAYHCRHCGRCTRHMDHHCPFLNNCVGLRNYKAYVLLLLYSVLCAAVALPLLLAAWRQRYYGCVDTDALLALAASESGGGGGGGARTHLLAWPHRRWLALMLLGFSVFAAGTGYLLAAHARLLWRGQTTLQGLSAQRHERFEAEVRLMRYGPCAPQTSTVVWAAAGLAHRCRRLCGGGEAETEGEANELSAGAEERGSHEGPHSAAGAPLRVPAAARGTRREHWRRLFGARQPLWRLALPFPPPPRSCPCCVDETSA